MARLLARIPRERVGILIGSNGRVKEHLEKTLGVNLGIDSETGEVTIDTQEGTRDPSLLLRAKDYVIAVGRGFSPGRADKILQDENNSLIIIDLREIFGGSQSDIRRTKGRIIGTGGKTRLLIENLSETTISIYGYTISIIGGNEQIQIAKEAINMFIKGRQHVTVYKYLQTKRYELRKLKLELWKDRSMVQLES